MPLPKYNVEFSERKEKWVLKNEKTDKIIKETNTKEKMIAGGVLERALGDNGGSVKIRKLNNQIQEERTFPPEADPSQSPG